MRVYLLGLLVECQLITSQIYLLIAPGSESVGVAPASLLPSTLNPIRSVDAPRTPPKQALQVKGDLQEEDAAMQSAPESDQETQCVPNGLGKISNVLYVLGRFGESD